jgi:hypothetical protein
VTIGPETHVGYSSYSAVLRDLSSDREVLVQVSAANGATTIPDAEQIESENDASFQGILQALVGLGVVELISAKKHGMYTAEVTLDTP